MQNKITDPLADLPDSGENLTWEEIRTEHLVQNKWKLTHNASPNCSLL